MLSAQLGRGRESRILRHCLDRLCRGCGGSILVRGAAGTGKTSLAEALIEEAARRGVAVRTGRARPEEQFLGHKLLMDALGADVGPAPDPGSTVAPNGSDRTSPTRLLRARLAELTRTSGLLVALDDLQCADAASLMALGQIVLHRDLPVLWFLTCQPATPGARDTTKRLLAGVRGAVDRSLELAPLGDADARLLASRLLGGRPGPRLEHYLARADGNPRFVTELCRGLREEGWLSAPDAAADSAAPGVVDAPWEIPLPRGFRALLGHPVDRLPASTRRLIRLLAACGAGIPIRQVGALAVSGTEEALEILQPAFAAGVLEHDGEQVRFRHPLMHAAVYESLPVSAQLAAKERVGPCLRDVDEGRHYLAWQHLLDRARRQHALSPAVSAKRARAPGATAPVAQPLGAERTAPAAVGQGALRDLPAARDGATAPDTELAPRLKVQKAWAEMAAGDIGAGERAAPAVLTVAGDPTVRVDALELLAESLRLQWGYAAAVPTLDQAINESDDDEGRARLRVGHAYSLALSGSLAEGTAELDQVHQTTTSSSTRARAASARALCRVLQGHLDEAIALADEAIGFDLVDWGDPRNRTCPHHVLGLALLNADQWDRAGDVIQQGIHCCEERGRLVDLPAFLWLQSTLLLLQGKWAEALAQAETGATISNSLGLRCNVVLLLDVIARIAAERGHPAAAADALMQAERILPATAVIVGPNRLAHTKARLHDDPAQAYAQLTAAWSYAQRQDAGAQLVELGPAYVSAALAAGDLAAARTASRSVGRAARRLGTHHARGTAERCAGLVRGDPTALQRGISLLARSPRVLDRADALVDFARLAAAAGQRTAAHDAVQEALANYRAVGAQQSATEAVESMTGLGVTCDAQWDGAEQHRTRCRSGWGSLTPTERAVAERVAEGLSNREIAQRLHISHRTVETHVSHALSKLGVRSRVGLAKAALTAGSEPTQVGSDRSSAPT